MNAKSNKALKQPSLEKKPLKESTPDVGKEYKRPLRPLRQQEPKKRPPPLEKKPLKESTPDVGKEYKRPLRPLRQQEPKKRPQPKKKK